MATTNEDLQLTGSIKSEVLLGVSSSFIIQNKTNRDVRFRIKDSNVKGGKISYLDSTIFNYDIEIWAEDASPSTVTNLYLVRD